MAEKWDKVTLRMDKDHRWKTKPGYSIFVADRGAVRFDIPRSWIVIPESDSIKFYNKPQPNDDCRLQLTVLYLNPQIDWSGIYLPQMLAEVMENDEGEEVISRGKPVFEKRGDLEIAWLETRRIDTGEHRPYLSRTCIARRGTIQPLLTFDYWPEDAKRFEPVWNEVLRSMRLGEYIKDPRKGV